MSEPITLLLVDDHHLVRQAVRKLLESEPDLKVVAELAEGLHVAEQVAKLRPTVLIVDLMLPGLGGLEVTRQVVRRTPATKVIVLSVSVSEGHVLEALRAGASAYVRKDASAEDLVKAIHEVHAGRFYLSPPFPNNAIEIYRQRAFNTSGDAYDRLTPREREVFHLAAEGFGNVEIAPRLGISPRTVETHRARVMRKLGLRRAPDVVHYAIQRGILSGAAGEPLGEMPRAAAHPAHSSGAQRRGKD
jgi:DNA-binding NarL/FixJ family response regulator